MRALFYNFAVIEDDNLIRPPDRGEAVGNYDHGPVGGGGIDGFLDLLLCD